MSYPYGHHHHNRCDEEEENYPTPPPPHFQQPFDPHHPSPPPPFYNQPPPPPQVRPPFDPHHPSPSPPFYNEPPPPQVHHYSHGGNSYPPPPTHHYSPEPQVYPPAPHRPDPYSSGSTVHHVSHQSNNPHVPSSGQNHTHTGHQSSDYLSQKPSVRVYSKAETNYSLSIRDGKVILARADPSDPFQHWVKDEKYSTKVKDEQGFPSFALVNKATGQAMKHSVGATHPVQLTPYVPDKLDESILWTFSVDLGDSYRTIRMINNIRLNVDALNGDKNHGGVRDGTTIVLWEWAKGENQRWKIVPY